MNYNLDFDWSQYEGIPIDEIAQKFCIERFAEDGGAETDDQLRRRIIRKFMKFKNSSGTFYDLVHTAEQAILRQTPVCADYTAIRRQVGLGLIAKNKTGGWFERLKTACKAFWSCL